MLAFTSATQIDEYKLRLLESRMTERVDSPPRQEVKSPSPSPKQKHTKVVSDEVRMISNDFLKIFFFINN